MPRHEPGSNSRRVAYVGLLLLFIIAVAVRTRSAIDVVASLGDASRPPIDLELPSSTIMYVHPNAAAAGIHTGDTLRQVNGHPYRGASDLYAIIHAANPGDNIDIQVERPSSGSQVIDADVGIPQRRERAPLRDWIQNVVVAIGMPVVCLLVGFWVAVARIRDPQAWVVLFVLTGFAQQSGTGPMTLFGWDDWFQPIGVLYHQTLANGWPIAMMLFGLYFPERLSLDRRWPLMKWVVLAPLTIHLVLNVAIKLSQAHNSVYSVSIENVLAPFDRPLFLLGLIGISFFFFGTAVKTAHTQNRDARRRLSLLLWGAAFSLTPMLLIVIKDFLLRQPQFQSTPEWLLLAVLLPVFFFPLTLAYVIVVQRAMDVRVVVRQGLQYVLARGGILAVQFLLSMLIVYAATTVMANEMLIITGCIAGVALIGRSATWLRGWIDRRFFREAYNAELILEDLAAKVRTMIETAPLLETVAHRVADTLHVSRVALLLNNGGSLELSYALGYPEHPAVSFPENGVTARRLWKDQQLRVDLDDPEGWYRESPETERESLTKLQPELLLPLSLNERLLGVLSLGTKMSEEPYSGMDIQLLNSVATQMGFALENSRLTAAVASEVAQRERLNREIEIAREVQEHLFPRDLPQYAGLDYAGSCRPAAGVGGDYYDFVPLSKTELGIAIGDVSGKGIPAALLMASLRASLRGQTIRHEQDLALLMANVNILLYEGSSSNRYATFFYAQYNTVSHMLNYVNGGHNPPLIFRDGSKVIRLETGGPVVGLLPTFPYQQAEVELQPDDLFVAFTDGISEAMDSQDREWGEDRLIECARRCSGLTADRVMCRIVEEVDRFAAGAKQHDDMTIIVARISAGDSTGLS